ncbi:MAG: hypothetical protein JHC93_08635, partial [Parachlamydiales bacterium]|nr:hypothetical protein [Parachlamydiales bacterium]
NNNNYINNKPFIFESPSNVPHSVQKTDNALPSFQALLSTLPEKSAQITSGSLPNSQPLLNAELSQKSVKPLNKQSPSSFFKKCLAATSNYYATPLYTSSNLIKPSLNGTQVNISTTDSKNSDLQITSKPIIKNSNNATVIDLENSSKTPTNQSVKSLLNQYSAATTNYYATPLYTSSNLIKPSLNGTIVNNSSVVSLNSSFPITSVPVSKKRNNTDVNEGENPTKTLETSRNKKFEGRTRAFTNQLSKFTEEHISTIRSALIELHKERCKFTNLTDLGRGVYDIAIKDKPDLFQGFLAEKIANQIARKLDSSSRSKPIAFKKWLLNPHCY